VALEKETKSNQTNATAESAAKGKKRCSEGDICPGGKIQWNWWDREGEAANAKKRPKSGLTVERNC